MDIETHAEVIMREARYETWRWTGAGHPVVCFENALIVGFIHVFPTAADLLAGWESAQKLALTRHSPALRAAGLKAWNVYSIFLTAHTDGPPIEHLEEDFSATRKIARAGVRTSADLRRALLVLLPLQSAPVLGETGYEGRLRSRMKDLAPGVVDAFLGPAPAPDVVRVLMDSP
jgi:hypothetical protein